MLTPEGPPRGGTDAVTDLRRCIRDIVALSTLPALWARAEPREIAESLGDALLRILGCDFIYLRVNPSLESATQISVTCAQPEYGHEYLTSLPETLECWLRESQGIQRGQIHDRRGRALALCVQTFGYSIDAGVLVAGSSRGDFPNELESLALGVGGNQAAIAFQRHEAQQRERSIEQRFSQFMRNVPGLAWILDTEGRCVYANEAAHAALQAEQAVQSGRPGAPSGMFGKQELSVGQSTEGNVADQRVEELSGRHMLVTRFPIPAADGRLAYVGGIAIDITGRINAERALEESARRKDEFLAMLAHELRNPLAPVRNAAQILKRKAPLADDQRWAADMIDRQIEHMTRLIDDLLDVSRITRGGIELRKEPCVLQHIVQNAIESSRPLIEKWTHTLSIDMPLEPIHLQADSTRLTQAISNLLNNAAKYTAQGGRISLRVDVGEEEIAVKVQDNGIGIPADMLSRIFDMFVQVDRSLERSYGGLGIGLTLVKQLVEMHGGRVNAESGGPGNGSTLAIYLPSALRGSPQQAGSRNDALFSDRYKWRILIVDDNVDAARSLAELLRLTGAEVSVAYDGVEAVGAVAVFHPDIVLLDIGLPKLNGYEVVQRIRADRHNSGMTCIAVTGWGAEQDQHRAMEAGFDYHMTKPVDFAKLHKLLAQIGWQRQRRPSRSDEGEAAHTGLTSLTLSARGDPLHRHT